MEFEFIPVICSFLDRWIFVQSLFWPDDVFLFASTTEHEAMASHGTNSQRTNVETDS